MSAGASERQPHRVERRVARPFDHVDEHAAVRRDRDAIGEHVFGRERLEVGEHDHVGAPARGDQTEIGALQPVGRVVGRATQREQRVHAVGDEPAEQVIDAAVAEERQREQVVGRGDEMRRRERQAVHLGDDAGEDRVDHPAQLDRHSCPQLLETVGLGEDLVVGGHARREVRLEHRHR